jgi:tetratricopeptide (TPR) repeat protein
MSTNANQGAGQPTVFVSYSHKDEAWKDRLVGHLRVLEPEGVLEVWDDRRIAPGSDWLPDIQQAMDRAVAAVLLISADFLTSGFILGTEVPRLLERRKSEGLPVIPVIVRPCAWQTVRWLSPIQCRPKDGKPLSGKTKHKADEALSGLATDLYKLMTSPPRHPERSEGSGRGAPPRLDLGRLPIPGPKFVGRDAELARLDAAWEDAGIHVLTFVAFGGVGKTTLVGRWIDSMAKAGWREARQVLDWSFYSQGTEERVTSADRFLDHALQFFGDPDPTAGAARDRGLRLAELIRREKTLLILDGVEPLQHPPGPLAGRLKDPGLAALLKSLAAGNPGLCVVTTRERIADLEGFPQTAPQVDLEALSPETGAELLRELGVKGRDTEIRAASAELGNHALALTLMGNYLRRACDGDVRRRKEVDLGQAAERLGGHALRVIRAYARWLGEGPELAVLRLLGLFDRPAGKEALAALRAKPEIRGLTEPLMKKKHWWQKAEPISDEEWQWAVSSLREHGLLLRADPRQPGVLDAHPLVRVYFQEELEKERPQAWQEGNLRLYEHLQKVAPDLPETLESMEPLYAAVLHGCRAGRRQEAFGEVFLRRIRRGDQGFSWRKLGAFGSDLAALAGFFDRPWDQPSARLRPASQAFVLNGAAFHLRALGRLAEAVPPMQAGLGRYETLENWAYAARVASNLSELTLTLGEVGRAMAFGEQSVALADRSGDAFLRMAFRTTLADALHQAGRWEESAEAFREAEALQVERQTRYPRLYSVQGYQYCDLLLSRGEPEGGSGLEGLTATPEEAQRFRQVCREVRERAEQALEWAVEHFHFGLLPIALDHLSLGRSHLGLALTAAGPATPGGEAEADFAQAVEHLDRAVEGLRQAGEEEFVARGLLARAAFHRLRGNLTGAAADLAEAVEIAERGGMRLFLCDAHLEGARLARGQGDLEGASRHVAQARRLVNETGYGRREREVRWLEGKVEVAEAPPS